ncbi:hypothetical protein GGX14DRAFT_555536 [Mycena pura]|uniref:Uncharacterized protein n=1 Tax=Mycena pura TaxID=153505 RepID=A0AAD7E3M5_9AGAR|nr:hypothetical protein GGX14DRAFT_555536 [Mycena pura]
MAVEQYLCLAWTQKYRCAPWVAASFSACGIRGIVVTKLIKKLTVRGRHALPSLTVHGDTVTAIDNYEVSEAHSSLSLQASRRHTRSHHYRWQSPLERAPSAPGLASIYVLAFLTRVTSLLSFATPPLASSYARRSPSQEDWTLPTFVTATVRAGPLGCAGWRAQHGPATVWRTDAAAVPGVTRTTSGPRTALCPSYVSANPPIRPYLLLKHNSSADLAFSSLRNPFNTCATCAQRHEEPTHGDWGALIP